MENTSGKQEIPVENSVETENSTIENISNEIGKTPIPAEPPVESEVSNGKTKLPKKRRAAVCLDCSNEWMANNGNEKKPSRCPVCGSRKLKWKNEVTNSTHVENNSSDDGRIEIPPENPVESPVSSENPEPGETPVKSVKKPKVKKSKTGVENPVEIGGKSVLEKPMTLEDAEKLVPKIPMQAIVFIVGGLALFAGICFLVGKGKRQLSMHKKAAEEKKQEIYFMPNLGGNLA